MEMKTKYDLGDKVYIPYTINSIQISIDEKGNEKIVYTLKNEEYMSMSIAMKEEDIDCFEVYG